jgi:hypothetical protein
MWFCILSRVPKRHGYLLYLCGWKRKEEGDGHVKSSTPRRRGTTM